VSHGFSLSTVAQQPHDTASFSRYARTRERDLHSPLLEYPPRPKVSWRQRGDLEEAALS